MEKVTLSQVYKKEYFTDPDILAKFREEFMQRMVETRDAYVVNVMQEIAGAEDITVSDFTTVEITGESIKRIFYKGEEVGAFIEKLESGESGIDFVDGTTTLRFSIFFKPCQK